MHHPSRDGGQRSHTPSASPQHACDACRSRKIRCDRKKPKCTNCARSCSDCSFAQRGKRVNHTKRLMTDFADFRRRFDGLERALLASGRALLDGNSPLNVASSHPGARSNGHYVTKSDHHKSGDVEGYEQQLELEPQLQQQAQQQERYLPEPQQADLDRGNDFSDHVSAFAYLTSADDRISSTSPRQVSIQSIPEEPSASFPVISNIINGSDISPNERQPGPGSNAQSCAIAYSKTLKLQRRLLSTDGPPPSAGLLRKIDCVTNNLSSFRLVARDDFTGDRKSIELPPLLLLEAVLPEYLRTINSVYLVFSEPELRAAIDQQYKNQRSSTDPAWAVSFTSIVVHMLYLDSRSSSGTPSTNDGHQGVNPMETGIAMALVSNLRRSFNHFEKLIEPSLANLQALATVALAGQSCFHQSTVDAIIQIACHTGGLMGLQTFNAPILLSNDKIKQRDGLLWTLFILDKQMAMITGRPPRLWSFNLNIPPPATLPLYSSSSLTLRISWCELATIQEEVWRTMFWPRRSCATMSKYDGIRKDQLAKLEALGSSYQNDFESTLSSAAADEWKMNAIDFQYALQSTVALILRDCQDDLLKGRLYSSCRYCLRLLKSTQSYSSKMQHAFFLRVLHLQPLVPFLEIYESVIECGTLNGDLCSDIELLLNILPNIRALTSGTPSNPYLSQLYSMLSSLMDVLTAFTGQSLSQRHLRAVQSCELENMSPGLSQHSASSGTARSVEGSANYDVRTAPDTSTMVTWPTELLRNSLSSEDLATLSGTLTSGSGAQKPGVPSPTTAQLYSAPVTPSGRPDFSFPSISEANPSRDKGLSDFQIGFLLASPHSSGVSSLNETREQQHPTAIGPETLDLDVIDYAQTSFWR